MALPTSTLIETNRIPNDEEIKQIQVQVIEPCVIRLKELEADIASLKAQLHDLERERNVLSYHIDHHCALIAPIRRLPHDILREIFIQCLPTDDFALMKTSEAPLLLGRVCSAWRQVALVTPRLWQSMHIPYTNAFEQTSSAIAAFKTAWRSRLDGISLWLSRSGTLPLSISCHFSDARMNTTSFEQWVQNPPLVANLLGLLLSVKDRWRHVHISKRAKNIDLSPILGVEPNSVPLLESLSLQAHDEWIGLGFPSNILKSPQLRNLLVQPLNNNLDTPACRQLTSLSISFATYPGHDIRRHLPVIFTRFQYLVEFSLIIVERSQDCQSISSMIPPTTFPCLQRLTLQFGMNGFYLLHSFRAPELKHLKLTLTSYGNDERIFKDFFSRFPPLETLFLAFS
ncbi:hypothetical protein AX16_005444 [Volvariella volvacea WC 439]|nr:hypothetical protein AX16_005444 [Volvariella volvacea WC 439]